MKTKADPIKQQARKQLWGVSRRISIGRSSQSAAVGRSTPVTIVEGNGQPELHGQPYLKTTFSNGRGFSKVLYTPSTMHITVGAEWKP